MAGAAATTAAAVLFGRLVTSSSPSITSLDHVFLHLPLSWPTWANLGLWGDEKVDYSGACVALARAVGDAAHVGHTSGGLVFDCGFGCGDQLELWREMGAGRVEGVTPSAGQLEVARGRAQRAGLAADKLLLGASDDVDSLFPLDGAYDSVVAVDCAYHFTPSRFAFFTSANRLLRAGGALGVSDMVLDVDPSDLSVLSLTWWRLLPLRLFMVFGGVPWANHTGLKRYLADLERAGFSVTSATDVSQQVFLGFANFVDRLTQSIPTALERAIPKRFKMVARGTRSLARSGRIRYVVIGAIKKIQ